MRIPLYNDGAEPELIEGNVFRITITVPEYGEQSGRWARGGDQVHDQAARMSKHPHPPASTR